MIRGLRRRCESAVPPSQGVGEICTPDNRAAQILPFAVISVERRGPEIDDNHRPLGAPAELFVGGDAVHDLIIPTDGWSYDGMPVFVPGLIVAP
jgi:hypothetical protein